MPLLRLVAPGGPRLVGSSLPSLSPCSILCLGLKTLCISFISTPVIELGTETDAHGFNTKEAEAGRLLQV